MYIAKQDQTYVLTQNNRNAIVHIEVPSVVENGCKTDIPQISWNGSCGEYRNARDLVQIHINHLGDGLFYIRRIWKNISMEARRIQTEQKRRTILRRGCSIISPTTGRMTKSTYTE